MTVRDQIIAAARARLGVPYGMPPGPNQLDCSLYVLRVLDAAGVRLPPGIRTAEDIRQACVPIGWPEVKPGDLLFFENTYDAGPPSADGHIATHIGISLGSGTRRMLNAVEPSSRETDIGTPYWQEHALEARRIPALVGADPPPDGGLTSEADHRFTFAELWPTIQAAGAEFGFDAQVLAAIMRQESGYRNWRVHADGTGHGLLGLDDGGLLPDFERWSGLTIGRGQGAASIPVVPQIRFAAMVLAGYVRRYGGAYAAARAWHRGERQMDDDRGRSYEQTIRGHVAALFGSGQPSAPPPQPPPISAPPPRLRTTDAGVRLRAEPTTDSAILAAVPKGTRVEPLDERAWRRVRVWDREGWMADDYLEDAP